MNYIKSIWDRRITWLDSNSKAQTIQQIMHHFDLHHSFTDFETMNMNLILDNFHKALKTTKIEDEYIEKIIQDRINILKNFTPETIDQIDQLKLRTPYDYTEYIITPITEIMTHSLYDHLVNDLLKQWKKYDQLMLQQLKELEEEAKRRKEEEIR